MSLDELIERLIKIRSQFDNGYKAVYMSTDSNPFIAEHFNIGSITVDYDGEIKIEAN